MKLPRTTWPGFAVVLVSGLAAGWIVARHWNAADGAGPRPVIAAGDESTVRRVALKQEIASALLWREIDLAEAAARFRELNGNDAAAIALLRDLYPRAGDDELAFRQVLHFVRWVGQSPRGLVATRLPEIESEFFARFPSADPFPAWFRTDYPVRPDAAPPPPTRRSSGVIESQLVSGRQRR